MPHALGNKHWENKNALDPLNFTVQEISQPICKYGMSFKKQWYYNRSNISLVFPLLC